MPLQDVAALLAATGTVDTAYREFAGDGTTPSVSHWRLLRQVAPQSPDLAAQVSGRSVSTPVVLDAEQPPMTRSQVDTPLHQRWRDESRDDAFMVASLNTQASHREGPLRSASAADGSIGGLQPAPGAAEPDGRISSNEMTAPAAEPRREGGLLRLSLAARDRETSQREPSLASVLQRVSS